MSNERIAVDSNSSAYKLPTSFTWQKANDNINLIDVSSQKKCAFVLADIHVTSTATAETETTDSSVTGNSEYCLVLVYNLWLRLICARSPHKVLQTRRKRHMQRTKVSMIYEWIVLARFWFMPFNRVFVFLVCSSCVHCAPRVWIVAQLSRAERARANNAHWDYHRFFKWNRLMTDDNLFNQLHDVHNNSAAPTLRYCRGDDVNWRDSN